MLYISAPLAHLQPVGLNCIPQDALPVLCDHTAPLEFTDVVLQKNESEALRRQGSVVSLHHAGTDACRHAVLVQYRACSLCCI